MGHTEEIPSGCSRHLTAYDDAIPGDEHFLNLELHVGDGLGKASDHFDRGIAAPAFAGKIAPARLVVRGEDLLLERLHIALDRLVEQAVPRGDHGARLSLGQTLCRGGQGTGQHGGGGDELSEPLHGVPPWSESSIDPCAINDLGTLALVVALPASQLSANRDVKIGLGLVPASIGETVSEHRSTTLGFRLRSLVLKHIPVFDENSIHDAEDIRRDPALWPAMSREASVDDHEIPLGHDHAGLIFQRRRHVLDHTDEAIAEIQQSSALHHVRTDASFFRSMDCVCALVQAFIPPSTVRFAPVMYEDSGPATNATNAATSSTRP